MTQLSLFPEFQPEWDRPHAKEERLCGICKRPLVGKHPDYRNLCPTHARQQRRFLRAFKSSDRLQTAKDIQNNRCLICGQQTQLVVDHDHENMTFRGLLCSVHNWAIGMFADDPQHLKNAAEYLEVFGEDVWRMVAFHNWKTQTMWDSDNRLARALAMLERLHND